MKFNFFPKTRKKRKRKRAKKKIREAVKAFLYLDNALKAMGIPRQRRRQIKRDLISLDDPGEILIRFNKFMESL